MVLVGGYNQATNTFSDESRERVNGVWSKMRYQTRPTEIGALGGVAYDEARKRVVLPLRLTTWEYGP